MNEGVQSIPRVDPLYIPTSRQWRALHVLSEALQVACEEGRDIWQFAVEIQQLRASGLSHTELRSLLCRGYIEHAQEHIAEGSERVFHRLSNLALPERTCFVLTPKGCQIVSLHVAEQPAKDPAPFEEEAARAPLQEVPHWDSQSRQLWWRDCLIKRFCLPAVNQERVLEALEEEGWPPRIDDPLPGTPTIDPKVRLHDTIKALNRHHQNRIICFRGDGRGQGIRWLVVDRR